MDFPSQPWSPTDLLRYIATAMANAATALPTSVHGRVTAQTGAANIATLTVGAADATYSVRGNINCTAFTSGNFSISVTYTDETNTSRTFPMFGHFTSGWASAVSGTGAFECSTLTLRAKAGTTITIATTGTFTNLTYNAEAAITQVQ